MANAQAGRVLSLYVGVSNVKRGGDRSTAQLLRPFSDDLADEFM